MNYPNNSVKQLDICMLITTVTAYNYRVHISTTEISENIVTIEMLNVIIKLLATIFEQRRYCEPEQFDAQLDSGRCFYQFSFVKKDPFLAQWLDIPKKLLSR